MYSLHLQFHVSEGMQKQKQNAAANTFFSMHLVMYSKIMHLKSLVVFNPTKSKENENELFGLLRSC